MERLVDFHVHYDPLDNKSRERIIDQAKLLNIVAVGLVGRDDITEFGSTLKYAAKQGIFVLPGVETLVKGDAFNRTELVCLNFDYSRPEIKSIFGREEQRKKNMQIAEIQKQFLRNQGITFDHLDDENNGLLETLLNGEVSEKAIRFCNLAVMQAENQRVIDHLLHEYQELWYWVENNYKEKDFYKKDPSKLVSKFLYLLWFDIGKPGYKYTDKKIGGLQITAQKVIDAVHAANGISLYSPEGEFDISTWIELRQQDIDGIMGWHASKLGLDSRGVDIDMSTLRRIRKDKLLVLGGSDYQGLDWKLGSGNGNMFISPKRLTDIENYYKGKFGISAKYLYQKLGLKVNI